MSGFAEKTGAEGQKKVIDWAANSDDESSEDESEHEEEEEDEEEEEEDEEDDLDDEESLTRSAPKEKVVVAPKPKEVDVMQLSKKERKELKLQELLDGVVHRASPHDRPDNR